MRFGCECGNVISNTTDFLPYSARLIADTDLYDYWEAWERRGRGQDLGHLDYPMDYEKIVYQCEKCKRLYFDDPDDASCLISFVPEDKNVMVTHSIKGSQYRGYLTGYRRYGEQEYIVTWNNGRAEEEHTFSSYEEASEYFHAKVNELRDKDLLNFANFFKDGKTVFSWSIYNETPEQETYVLYLTPEESEAIARFKTDHMQCRGGDHNEQGWQYSYEVTPYDSSSTRRYFKISCRKCGSFIESDGEHIQVSKESCFLRIATDELTQDAFNVIKRYPDLFLSETYEKPERYYDIATAVGYVRGVVDTVKMLDPEAPLQDVVQKALTALIEDESLDKSVRDIIQGACEKDRLDWVLVHGFEHLEKLFGDSTFKAISSNDVKERKG